MKIRYLDGPRLRRALVAACDYTEGKRRELNRINVFPVPDGDTGTNLALTLRSIGDHLRRTHHPGVGRIAGEAAEAAVLGARGNSGMMLSHFLLGFASGVEGQLRITTLEFTEALEKGVGSLYAAIEKPVEGTILTVMRETAEEARTAESGDFIPFLQNLLARARTSLEATPDLLPALKKAGVVDAGAKGFVHLLEGVVEYTMTGTLVMGRAPDPTTGGAEAADSLDPISKLAFEDAEERFRYCTEALVRGTDLPPSDEVRARLRDMGDSLVVIRTGEVLKVHIHTDAPGEVFGYLKGLGRLAAHKAEDMQAQHATIAAAASGHRSLARRPLSVVTESAHDLPGEVIAAHGIQVVPLLLMDGDDVLRDGVDITAEEFHARMDRGDRELPTTSQPSPASFLEAFHRAAEEGEEILYVGLSSTLSGTFQSAEAAASRFEGTPLHLFDSRGASLLEGLLVLKAAELGEKGIGVPEIKERLERARERSGIFFTVDRFDRLLASGRVGKGKAWLGSLLKLKPILALDEKGVVYPAGAALGRERVMEKVLDRTAEKIPPGTAPVRFGVVHVARPEIVDQLAMRIRERWGDDVEVLGSPAAPVLATHLGPGAWGIAWLVDEE
jgi:uncharacterized protein